MNKGIVLLSGGLDSVVSIAKCINEIEIELALTFDYGQKSFTKEYEASKKIANHYNIKHECIKLDFLKNITHTALVSNNTVPEVVTNNLDNKNITINSMKNVWVPNRNALFINIAAAYADSYKYDYIIIGANKEEATTFSDNSKKFINDINKSLETSTNHYIKVIAPLIDLDKTEIVKKAIKLNAPLKLIYSCYNSSYKHCGKCESCNRLKRALLNSNCDNIIKEIFE